MTPIIIYLTSPTKPLDTSLCRIITDDSVNMLRSRHMGWPSLASDSDGRCAVTILAVLCTRRSFACCQHPTNRRQMTVKSFSRS